MCSENPTTGEKGFKKVTSVFVNETDVLVKVDTGNELIEATSSHPFWVEGKGWVAAKDLVVGGKARTYTGQVLEITNIMTRSRFITLK